MHSAGLQPASRWSESSSLVRTDGDGAQGNKDRDGPNRTQAGETDCRKEHAREQTGRRGGDPDHRVGPTLQHRSVRGRDVAREVGASCHKSEIPPKAQQEQRHSNPKCSRRCVNGNRNPHICGNRKLHTSGEDVSGGADILPVMLVGRFGLDAGSGATGVLANTRREAAEPAVTVRLPHAVRPTLSSASADAPASGSCCPGC